MKKLLTTISILLIATAGYAQATTVERVTSSIENTNPEAVRDYWTPERMRNAKPMEKGFVVPEVHSHAYTVERVIDGDTLKLTNDEEVQLIGIKAPEDGKMGQEATDYIKGLIGYSLPVEVRLDFDVRKKDKYGRLLAYVYSGCYCQWNNNELPCNMEEVPDHEYVILKGSKKDNVWCNFVNATMIKAGYATPMTIPPNVKYADLFQKLYKEARDNQRGLWSEESDLLLMDFKSGPIKIAIPMH